MRRRTNGGAAGGLQQRRNQRKPVRRTRRRNVLAGAFVDGAVIGSTIFDVSQRCRPGVEFRGDGCTVHAVLHRYYRHLPVGRPDQTETADHEGTDNHPHIESAETNDGADAQQPKRFGDDGRPVQDQHRRRAEELAERLHIHHRGAAEGPRPANHRAER